MRPPYRTVFTIIHHIYIQKKFILFVLKIIILARQSFRVLTSYMYSKTCLKLPLSKRPKMGFQDQLSLNVGQKYCRMLQGEHSAILSTCNELPHSFKTFVLSIFERPLKTGFTVCFILVIRIMYYFLFIYKL